MPLSGEELDARSLDSLSPLISSVLLILPHIELTSWLDSISGFHSEAVKTSSLALSTVSFLDGYLIIQFSQKERMGGSSGNRTHLMNRFSIANSSADNSENGFIFLAR
ncbi:MAG: hypothetical protein ABIN80_12775 [Dyadobacter sp.]|uniref:hypothetical protein n=1 Tax=Dyadobacter sp. TaxID=1914288 RepID=UPI0032649030